MKSRCVEVMKLVDKTYDQYKHYGKVILKPTPNSLAIMLESVVFPNPGGP